MTDHGTSAAPDDRQLPAWVGSVGPGWTVLLDRLHHQLQALAPDYRIDSLTTRFGGLRITVADRFAADGEYDGEWADAATELTDAVELASERTCECCGSPGQPTMRSGLDGIRIQTLCEPCGVSSAERLTGLLSGQWADG